MSNLTFKQVHDINVSRCKKWHSHNDEWTGADWSNAVAGEVGEMCNVVKKIRRDDFNNKGSRDPDRATLLQMLADEMADVFLYLDLLSEFYNIDLPDAITSKFNRVSEQEGFSEWIGLRRKG